MISPPLRSFEMALEVVVIAVADVERASVSTAGWVGDWMPILLPARSFG
jgi:hypothetical protein